ncbi:MAG: TIGR03915 family putative DNA repair protein [Oscillospiraceae bacterium]|nr:TIGR03915 family putative DNA repair protein [Oscillospiraceae bacterium]
MFERADVVYVFDGSYEGLLCCVFESYARKETPRDVVPELDEQLTFYERRYVSTDETKAGRVERGIIKAARTEAAETGRLFYLTCCQEKGITFLLYAQICLTYGAKTHLMITDDTIKKVREAVSHLTREAHQLKGFVRFSVNGSAMTSIIEPKNFVLPLLREYFCNRYRNEAFLIYDKAHKAALIYSSGESDIIPVEDFEEPETEDDEERFRELWRLFYNTVAIEERENPRCRMSHMQKRYWEHMTEMRCTQESGVRNQGLVTGRGGLHGGKKTEKTARREARVCDLSCVQYADG